MIPKIWKKKVKKCPKCGDTSILNGWVTKRIWADDIGGRIFCPKCNKTFNIDDYGISRYKIWKMLVEGWNRKVNESEDNKQ